MDMSFWCLTCLSILGLLVCTQGPESSFDYSTTSYLPMLCRSLIWPLQWQTSSSPWIRWPSLVQRELGLAQSPYREFIQCLVGTEVAASQSRRGCCARTPRWVGGRTSHFAVCWWIGRGTDQAPGWHILFVCLSGGTKLWRRKVIYLVACTVP